MRPCAFSCGSAAERISHCAILVAGGCVRKMSFKSLRVRHQRRGESAPWLLWAQGYKRPLQMEDMFELAPGDRVQAVSKDFELSWRAQLAKKESGGKPSLVRLLVHQWSLDLNINPSRFEGLIT